MTTPSRISTLCSYVALACGCMLMSPGCQGASEDKPPSSGHVSLEIRFQDDTAPTPQPTAGAGKLPFASLAAAQTQQAVGPTTHAQVARILVDITTADTDQPFFLNFDLTQIATDVWRGDVPFLPRDQQFRFAARALDANGDVAFSGDTVATLTVDNQSLQIPLAPAQDGQIFQMPRMLRIAYPGQIYAGAEEQVAFTILGNAGAAIGIQITPLGSPMTPAPEFAPASGTVTLTSTVADFMAVYTAPDVTADTDLDYQVTITDARAQTAVAITTNFRTHLVPRPPGAPIVHNIQPSVLFNPVILSLTANGSDAPGTVELVADVSDDSAPDRLTFQWSYALNPGTPDATFANNGQGNPGLFQGYTVAHEGVITLAVTDENNGTTTLHYPLALNQFADAIDHASVSSLTRIVAGDAHTCVLTGANRVRCWGDNQYGQLGYGNAIDVGDAPTRLPFTASDVPLPASDPVQQLVAGNNHTCALLASGLVYCWGRNNFGQLGYGRTDNLADDEPLTSFGLVTLGDLATRIAAGGDHTCAILASGALRCWGRNDFGQLGHGNTESIGDNEFVYSAGNVDLGPGVTVKDLALGGFHTCALLTTGAVRCWGRNTEGQLGYGNTANLGDDEPINNLPDVSLTGPVRKLVAGDLHTCALTFAGTLRCWGDGRAGQLGQSFGGGDGFWGNAANELPSNLPGSISTGAQITDVAAGDSHTCALSSDGQLRCWGRGDSGQLGYGNFAGLSTPPAAGVDLDGGTAYRITAGAAHTCALLRGGTARCWGQGADGRLGRGSTAASASATGATDIQLFAPPPTCGNGTLDSGEQCDDSNNLNGDACDDNCTAPRCGNGIVDPGEQCDDGNALSGDGCENSCTNTTHTGRYFIVDVFDHFGSNSTALTELHFVDANGANIPYTVLTSYDSAANGLPLYWYREVWGPSKLNDNNVDYVDSLHGSNSSMIVNYPSSGGDGRWSRILLDLGSSRTVDHIDLWAGSPELRIPHSVTFYSADSYLASNLSARDDTGLARIATLTFAGNETTVRKITVPVNGPLSCAAGTDDCDGNVVDGCETSTATDNSNCGMCGNACASGQQCTSGVCVIAPPVLNSADVGGNGCSGGGPPTVSADGLTMTGNGYGWVRASKGVSSGKWYYEVIVKPNTSGSSTSWGMLGVALDRAHDPALGCYPGLYDTNSEGWEFQGGRLYGSNGASGWSGASAAAGDVIGVYIDADARTVGFAKNCTFLGTAFVNLWSGALYPVLVDSWPSNYQNIGNAVLTASFAGPYHCPVPAGYSSYAVAP